MRCESIISGALAVSLRGSKTNRFSIEEGRISTAEAGVFSREAREEHSWSGLGAWRLGGFPRGWARYRTGPGGHYPFGRFVASPSR